MNRSMEVKPFTATILSLALLASACAQTSAATGPGAPPAASGGDSQTLRIARSGARPVSEGPAENFTGAVRIETLFQASEPARAAGAAVTFAPGARTAWHTHPLGQTLIVTAGAGRVQRWGGPIQEIRPGDVVSISPNEKHWHGASPDAAMTHIAVQENLDGEVVTWMEKVSDAQYGARP
jgi:quercetin dioxygenase-like cupin family protein